jgi:hypothetical protein
VGYLAGIIGLFVAWYYQDLRIGLAVPVACLLLLSLDRVAQKFNDVASAMGARIAKARRQDR